MDNKNMVFRLLFLLVLNCNILIGEPLDINDLDTVKIFFKEVFSVEIGSIKVERSYEINAANGNKFIDVCINERDRFSIGFENSREKIFFLKDLNFDDEAEKEFHKRLVENMKKDGLQMEYYKPVYRVSIEDSFQNLKPLLKYLGISENMNEYKIRTPEKEVDLRSRLVYNVFGQAYYNGVVNRTGFFRAYISIDDGKVKTFTYNPGLKPINQKLCEESKSKAIKLVKYWLESPSQFWQSNSICKAIIPKYIEEEKSKIVVSSNYYSICSDVDIYDSPLDREKWKVLYVWEFPVRVVAPDYFFPGKVDSEGYKKGIVWVDIDNNQILGFREFEE